MMGLQHKKYWKNEFGRENGYLSVRRVTGNVNEPISNLLSFRFTLSPTEVFDSYSGGRSDCDRLVYGMLNFVDGYQRYPTTCCSHL